MGIIYELLCLNTGKRYIGSSKLTKELRLQTHQGHYNAYLKNKHSYVSSFDILENNNYVMNVLENVDDNNLLLDREQYYYENNECINCRNPKLTLSVLRQRQKKDNELYKQRHPEKYKEHSNKRNIKVQCDICKSFISKRNIARHNKNHINEKLLNES